MTITRCTRIEITTGKSGRRTPVAYFEPVTILGRTVSCATLYSESCAAKLGIQPGSTIEVGLSNDITPKVYRVIDAPNNQDLTGTSACVDVIDTTEASVPVDVQTVQEEEEEDSLWIAPSLFPDWLFLHRIYHKLPAGRYSNGFCHLFLLHLRRIQTAS